MINAAIYNKHSKSLYILDWIDGNTCSHEQMNDLGNVDMVGDKIDDDDDF